VALGQSAWVAAWAVSRHRRPAGPRSGPRPPASWSPQLGIGSSPPRRTGLRKSSRPSASTEKITDRSARSPFVGIHTHPSVETVDRFGRQQAEVADRVRAQAWAKTSAADFERRLDHRAVALKLLEVLADPLQDRFRGDGVGVRKSEKPPETSPQRGPCRASRQAPGRALQWAGEAGTGRGDSPAAPRGAERSERQQVCESVHSSNHGWTAVGAWARRTVGESSQVIQHEHRPGRDLPSSFQKVPLGAQYITASPPRRFITVFTRSAMNWRRPSGRHGPLHVLVVLRSRAAVSRSRRRRSLCGSASHIRSCYFQSCSSVRGATAGKSSGR